MSEDATVAPPENGTPAETPPPIGADTQTETPPAAPEHNPACSGGCENCPGKAATALIEKLQSEIAELTGKINAVPAPVDYTSQIDAVQKQIKAAQDKAEAAVKLASQTAPPVPAAPKSQPPADPVAAFVRASIGDGRG